MISPFSSLRVRLVGIVFLAVAPAMFLLAYANLGWLWISFVAGLFALGAAWFGGELFILRRVKSIQEATLDLASGKLGSRTGLAADKTELGELARSLDAMAEALQKETMERARTEQALLNRAHQQTVVAALGQFALATNDVAMLLNQSVLLVAQTLEAEFCEIMELDEDERTLLLRTGVGWSAEHSGRFRLENSAGTQFGHTVRSGEPAAIADARQDRRFQPVAMLEECGIVAGVTVMIQGQRKPFGLVGVHSREPRTFTDEEIHFLQSVAALAAMAVERERTEPEIQKLAAFAKSNPNPVLEFSSEGRLTYFNDAAQNMATAFGLDHPGSVLPVEAPTIVKTCLATGEKKLRLETRMGDRILTWSFHPVLSNAAVHCYVEDMTDRLKLEEQLRQSQKMESVGQLAAGVAHDFNNILTIIQGHSGLLMSRPNLSAAMTTSIQAVSFAAERAAGLTRQLLMFSRKQVIEPKLLDLGEVVANLSKMLQRLIGETITLQCHNAPLLPPLKGDTGMIEQVLMNLTVNARDAMPRGGKLTISTDAVQVGLPYAKLHTDARPGYFVCLQVRDTGTGMDEATMKRIFEPFFTTKEAGKGTGLGLATVYGIVKQHSGWIEVNSQVGQGTTFKIFFPSEDRPAESQQQTAGPTNQVRGGSETVMVVEDEPVLRDLATLILQDCGYRVLEAASGVEALTVWQQNQGGVDLLLTDMIMPDGLSGKDLAETLVARKPKLKIVFTSGYNVDDMGDDSLVRASHFLQKPYSRFTLANAVRDSLDGRQVTRP